MQLNNYSCHPSDELKHIKGNNHFISRPNNLFCTNNSLTEKHISSYIKIHLNVRGFKINVSVYLFDF